LLSIQPLSHHVVDSSLKSIAPSGKQAESAPVQDEKDSIKVYSSLVYSN